jgi:hypothetical protein
MPPHLLLHHHLRERALESAIQQRSEGVGRKTSQLVLHLQHLHPLQRARLRLFRRRTGPPFLEGRARACLLAPLLPPKWQQLGC